MRLFIHLSRVARVMNRRLEDRIRELCAKVVSMPDTPEWNKTLQQLTAALQEHARRMRKLVAELPMRTDRRSAGEV
jgi:hypothetical protein